LISFKWFLPLVALVGNKVLVTGVSDKNSWIHTQSQIKINSNRLFFVPVLGLYFTTFE